MGNIVVESVTTGDSAVTIIFRDQETHRGYVRFLPITQTAAERKLTIDQLRDGIQYKVDRKIGAGELVEENQSEEVKPEIETPEPKKTPPKKKAAPKRKTETRAKK